MKKVYVVRGLPGSGKSTRAGQLAAGGGVVHSADDFFMLNGEYLFDVSRIKEAHEWNFAKFCQSLEKGVEVVVCDNTNSRAWEYFHYIEAAWWYGYQVEIESMDMISAEDSAARTVHNVPIEFIQKLINQWEPDAPIDAAAEQLWQQRIDGGGQTWIMRPKPEN